jgi:hypothetical protein
MRSADLRSEDEGAIVSGCRDAFPVFLSLFSEPLRTEKKDIAGLLQYMGNQLLGFFGGKSVEREND